MPKAIWLPEFACPRCGQPFSVTLDGGTAPAARCAGCGAIFRDRGGIVDCLLPEHAREIEPFIEQYRHVREQDGYRAQSPEYYRRLPDVSPDHSQYAEWRIRRETFDALCQRVLPQVGRAPLTVLDLGAGNGWIAHRLARLGHHTVAVDLIDDEEDGLGAWTHYNVSFVCVRADFDRLPFAPEQFDLVVFTGSLHYSPNVTATVGEAVRLLAPAGVIVALDSPTFRGDEDGRAMVAERDARFMYQYGLGHVIRRGVGYLTPAMLGAAAEAFHLELEFIPSTGSFTWAARRLLSATKLGRQPARFGMWVAQ